MFNLEAIFNPESLAAQLPKALNESGVKLAGQGEPKSRTVVVDLAGWVERRRRGGGLILIHPNHIDEPESDFQFPRMASRKLAGLLKTKSVH